MINISYPNILQYPTQLIRNWQVRYNCPMPPTPHTPHRGILFSNTYTKLFQILLSSSSKRLFTI
jgi:hypothetical protein